MRISVQTARIFERFGIDGGFARLHEWGFEGVDFGIRGWMQTVLPREEKLAEYKEPLEEIFRLSEPLRDAAKKHGVAFSQTHAPFPGWKPDEAEYNAAMLNAQRVSIALSGFLGAPYCIIHPVFHPENSARLSAEEEWALNRDFYTALIPTLREYKVVACLENMFVRGPEGMRIASVCSNFIEAAQWIDRLNDLAGEELFGFCFDTGHCNLTNQNIRRGLDEIGPRLKTLHIHDNDGCTDWHIAPYMGTTDWEDFIKGLRDIHYQNDLSFETFHALDRYPVELTEPVMRSIAQTGAYFKQRLSE